MVGEEPAQQLRFRAHVFGGLTAKIHALVVVAMLPYLWLREATPSVPQWSRTRIQPDVLGGITST